MDSVFINFLIKAKRNTYAAKMNQVDSIKEGSIDFEYRDGDYLYHDSYVGSTHFAGEEVVYYKDKPIWSMNYFGRVIGDNFSGDFLKEALMNNTIEMPYRGPSIYKNNLYEYKCKVEGDYDWYIGDEEIYYDNNKIYELKFNGGSIE